MTYGDRIAVCVMFVIMVVAIGITASNLDKIEKRINCLELPESGFKLKWDDSHCGIEKTNTITIPEYKTDSEIRMEWWKKYSKTNDEIRIVCEEIWSNKYMSLLSTLAQPIPDKWKETSRLNINEVTTNDPRYITISGPTSHWKEVESIIVTNYITITNHVNDTKDSARCELYEKILESIIINELTLDAIRNRHRAIESK